MRVLLTIVFMIAVGPAVGAVRRDGTIQANNPPASAKPRQSAAQSYFSDTVLLNQSGDSKRFYSDLLKDKVVVIDSFFTECQGVCPQMNRNMEAIQNWLGDRLGHQAVLISISVDPVNDTPARLKAYAERFHAKPGWNFLTGKKENVNFVLQKLGQNVAMREDHSTVIIIGNERTGLWMKAAGTASAEDLIRSVERALNDK